MFSPKNNTVKRGLLPGWQVALRSFLDGNFGDEKLGCRKVNPEEGGELWLGGSEVFPTPPPPPPEKTTKMATLVENVPHFLINRRY